MPQFLAVRQGRVSPATADAPLGDEVLASDDDLAGAGFMLQGARAHSLLSGLEGIQPEDDSDAEDGFPDSGEHPLPDAQMSFTSIQLFGTSQEAVTSLLAQDPARAAYVSPTRDGWTAVFESTMSHPVDAELLRNTVLNLDTLGEEAVRVARHLCAQLSVPAVLLPGSGCGKHLYFVTARGELLPIRYPDPSGSSRERKQTLSEWESLLGTVRNLFPTGLWSDALIQAIAEVFTCYPGWVRLCLWDALRLRSWGHYSSYHDLEEKLRECRKLEQRDDPFLSGMLAELESFRHVRGGVVESI